MFHVFGPSRSPPCFFDCLLGHPWAVRFRLMFHTLGLLGQFILHAICIFNKRCTSWFRIQYYTFATFYRRLRPHTLPPCCSRLKWRSLVFNDCFTFSACSASVVAFYIFLEVSWKRSVVTARLPPPFGAHMGSMLSSSGTRWHPLAAPWVAWVALWRWIW